MGTKSKDLTGQIIGRLKVLGKGSFKINKNGSKYRLWLCECKCGKKKEASAYALSNQKIRSCGCFHKDQLKERCWKGYQDIAGCYFSRIIRQAKERNLEFNITIEYIWDLYLKQDRRCALSGLPIIFVKKYSRECKKQTVSVDRIDSTKGYTEDNIQLVHKTVNVMKGSLSNKEFYNFCKILVDYNKFNQRISKVRLCPR